MLFWETLQCNKRFRSFIIDGDRKHEYMILILFYAFEYRFDTAKQGVIRMCVFILQTMSTETNFGKLLNHALSGQDQIPSNIRIPNFQGTYADFLIIVSRCTESEKPLTQLVNPHPYDQRKRQSGGNLSISTCNHQQCRSVSGTALAAVCLQTTAAVRIHVFTQFSTSQ